MSRDKKEKSKDILQKTAVTSISDLHLFHENAIIFDHRPFKSV